MDDPAKRLAAAPCWSTDHDNQGLNDLEKKSNHHHSPVLRNVDPHKRALNSPETLLLITNTK